MRRGDGDLFPGTWPPGIVDGWSFLWLQPSLVASGGQRSSVLGSRLAGRRIEVVKSFCVEAAIYYRAREDGTIDAAEAQELAKAVDRFFVDLEAAGRVLLEEEPCRTP